MVRSAPVFKDKTQIGGVREGNYGLVVATDASLCAVSPISF